LAPQVQSFTYVTPVAPLTNFEEVRTYVDPTNNITTYSYNSTTGTLARIDQPAVAKPGLGTSTPEQAFTCTAIGLPQTSQDAEGRITRYDYGDSTHADQVTKVTVDFGRLNLATLYGYDSFGDVNSVTNANGYTTTSTFDQLRRLTEVDAPVTGIVTHYSYVPNGQIETVTRNAAVPEITQYGYTLSDKVNVVTDALGNTSTPTYDVDDRVQTVTRQVSATQNRQRTYRYDALSRLFQISDTTSGGPGQLLETHSYTPNGRDLSFTDANSHTIVYGYDGLDRLSQMTFPDGTTQNNQFDANGNVLRTTTRSGQTIGFTYDRLNRIATKTPQGEAAGQVTFGYDLTGRLLQVLDLSSAIPYQVGYDTAGRANSYTDQQGRNTMVGYDGVGNRTMLQWPANTNGASPYFVTYQFDPMNRMTEIDENGSAAKPVAKYQWDLLSRLSLITFGDGSSDAYSQYDAGSNLQTLTLSFGGAQNNVTFTYEWLKNHQRQSTTVNNSALQYIPFIGTTSYASGDVNNGYTSAGATNFAYDGNHNLTFDGLNTLAYDAEDRLIQAQNAIIGQVQYLYDPLSHRKQKEANGLITQFVLVGDEEIADFTGAGAGTPQMLTVRGVGGLPVAAVTPVAGVQPEMVVYYHHDVLGSSVAGTQAGQSGAVAHTYSEFGAPGAGDWFTYRFAGYRYDTETGLYYVRARYYSPSLGRFLQTDPVGIIGGANLYAYVGNDPLNRTDPTGLWFGMDDAVFAFGGGLIGAGGQLLTDAVFKGQLSSGRDVAAAFVGGAVTGETALYAVPTLGPAGAVIAGAAGGAASNLTGYAIDRATDPSKQFDGAKFVFDTSVGALTGLIPAVGISGVTAGTNSYSAIFNQITTKAMDGTISSVTFETALKMLIGQSAGTLLGGFASGLAGAGYNAALGGGEGQPSKK
jgi:RHS repeat-associated protein